MLNAFLFFLELFLLFLISRQLTILLSQFFHTITRSKKMTIYLIAFLFFPGTLIHELAHYITARLLFVRVVGMALLPKLEGENVKLGSVSMVKPDIFRSLFIGMAPFFCGTILLLTLFFVGVKYGLFNNQLLTILIGYAVFEIGNTMFSSKKDMEGAIELLGILAAVFGIFYFFGFRIPSINPELFFSLPVVAEVLQRGVYFLLVPLGIDIILIILLRLLF